MSVIRTSSKMALRLSCLEACDQDVRRAAELYDYLSGGMDNLPDVDPIAPSGLQKAKAGADEVIGWLGEHRDDIRQGIALVQQLRSNMAPSAPSSPVPDVPPIPVNR